jgi:hypothetical protein
MLSHVARATFKSKLLKRPHGAPIAFGVHLVDEHRIAGANANAGVTILTAQRA